MPRSIPAVREQRLTYLEEEALLDLHKQVRRIERSRIKGVIVEAGCALGGAAIVLASAKARKRSLYVYDVFDMIPPPSERDGEDVHERYEIIRSGQSKGIGGDSYYGYKEELLEEVKANFRRNNVDPEAANVHFIKGLFQDTMHLDDPIALAHIDGDWYESVMTCLERLGPNLVNGGLFVIDDYKAWSGCREAVDDYFASRKEEFEFIERARLHIVRR